MFKIVAILKSSIIGRRFSFLFRTLIPIEYNCILDILEVLNHEYKRCYCCLFLWVVSLECSFVHFVGEGDVCFVFMGGPVVQRIPLFHSSMYAWTGHGLDWRHGFTFFLGDQKDDGC